MEFKIGKQKVGDDQPTFIVAELSSNHLGKFDLAVKTIEAIKKSGADAVKLQTFRPDFLGLNCNNKYFGKIKNGLWKGWTAYQIFQAVYKPWEWQPKLKKIANELGLMCFSSPFDKIAVDFLAKMNVPAYKVASPEITDIPLIEYIASQGKPVIISTGVATLNDIKEAVKACWRKGNKKIALLKCVSAYPTPLEEVNLRTIPFLKKKFKTVVGLSDHTLEPDVGLAAVALGAQIVEKHFILSHKLPSQDRAFSLEPAEFKEMVDSIRRVEKALGEANYKLSAKFKAGRSIRRSIFVIKDVKKGEVFTDNNIRSIRPGYGLHPKFLPLILGKKTKVDIKRGIPLKWSMIEGGKKNDD